MILYGMWVPVAVGQVDSMRTAISVYFIFPFQHRVDSV